MPRQNCDEQRLGLVERRLRRRYGTPRHHNPTDPLSDLVFLVLSRMTQEVKYLRAYRRLRSRFASWEALAAAPRRALEAELRETGLAKTKAEQISQLLQEIMRREGRLSLVGLRKTPDEEALRYLTTLAGVGGKTARCVMLYTLDRSVLPVDVHVWRVAQRLGYAEEMPWSPARAERLESRVPPNLRSSLHVTFIALGRDVCRPKKPRCSVCVLTDICPSSTAQEAPSSATVKTSTSCPSTAARARERQHTERSAFHRSAESY